MPQLTEIALCNAAVAVPLAVLAFVVSRFSRRPALSHALWLVVLVKLITPPIWRLPVVSQDWLVKSVAAWSRSIDQRLAEPQSVDSVFDIKEAASLNFPSTDVQFSGSQDDSVARPKVLPPRRVTLAIRVRQYMQAQWSWLTSSKGLSSVGYGVLIVWGCGSIAWFSVQAFRCFQFERALRMGLAAPPDLVEEMNRLALRAGCSRVPQVWLMPGILSPMLWSTGRSSRIVFPVDLISRMDAASRESLLAHELAHFARGDHWVRIIAFVSTGVFWWHPAVWFARYFIEAAEEECCDAWVITRAKAAPRCYAEAILEAIDFLSERRVKPLPLATGLGQLRFLRQRLTWIMRGPRGQGLTWLGRGLCILLIAVLPLQPTWLAARSTSVPNGYTEGVSSDPSSPSSSDPDVHFNSSGSTATDPGQTISGLVEPDSISVTQHHETSLPTPADETPVLSADQQHVLFIGPARQWLVDRKRERMIDLSPYRVRYAAFARKSHWVATGGLDGFVRLWNLSEMKEVATWYISGGPVSAVAISSEGTLVAGGGKDGIVRLWSLIDDESPRELPREPAPVTCVRFAEDDSQLAVASGDSSDAGGGRISIWETGDWRERISMNWNQPTAAIEFGRDGRSLISGDWHGRVGRWNAVTGELLGFVDGHHALIVLANMSPDISKLSNIRVPDLPLSILIGDGQQDEQIKSVWDRISKRTTVFAKPFVRRRSFSTMP